MNEALAHETIFPHIHPHPHWSAGVDLALSVLFLSGLLAAGRLGVSLLRRLFSDSGRGR